MMKYYRNFLRSDVFVWIFFLTASVAAQQNDTQLRLARTLENNHQYEQALKIYKSAYEAGKKTQPVISGVNRCLNRLQDYPQLIQFLEKVIDESTAPNSWRVELGEAYLLNGEPERAMQVWEQQLKMEPGNPILYRRIASALIRQRRFDTAIDIYKRGMKTAAKSSSFYLDIANLYRAQLNLEKAAEYYLLFYTRNRKQFNFLQRQILNLTSRTSTSEPVVKALNTYISNHPEDENVKEILAGLYVRDRNFEKAYFIYRQLENKKNNGRFLMRFANEAFKNNAYEYAIKAFEDVRRLKLGNRLQAAFGLAGCYRALAYLQRKGKLENDAAENMQQAEQLFLQLAAQQRNVSVAKRSLIRLGDIYYNFYFDLDRAIGSYLEYERRFPRSAERESVRLKLGRVYLTKGMLAEAEKIFISVKNRKYTASAEFFSGEIDFFRGRFSKAIKHYDRVLQVGGTGDSLANNVLGRRLLISSFSSDSLTLAAFASAEFLVAQRKLSEAVKSFTTVFHKKTGISPAAARRAAGLLMRLEKFSDAHFLLAEQLAAFPDDLQNDQTLFLLAKSELEMKEFDAALQHYQQLMKDFPTSLLYEDAREQARLLSQLRGEQSG